MNTHWSLAHHHSRPWVSNMAGTVVRVAIMSGYLAGFTNRMTVPPYLYTVASLSVWGTVWLSTRRNSHALFIITCRAVTIIGKANSYMNALCWSIYVLKDTSSCSHQPTVSNSDNFITLVCLSTGLQLACSTSASIL